MRQFVVSLLCAGLSLGAAQPVAAQKIIEKQAKVAAGQQVVLDLRFGNTIRIRPATDNQLHVRTLVNINGNKLNDALQLSLTETGSSVTLATDLNQQLLATAQPGDCPPNGSTMHFGDWNGSKGKQTGVCTDISYEILVPAGATVRVNTISGNIDVAGLTGALEAKSVSGSVDVSWPSVKGASVALKTITGEVYTDQEVAFEKHEKNPIVGYQLRGALAGGNGPLLKLESVSGDVFFRKPKQ